MITLFSLIISHSHRCFQIYIYSRQNLLRHVIDTATIRVLQKFHYNYHGDYRIVADSTWICHLEHCCQLTSILGRRPQSNYPKHSIRMHLHHLLLDTYQPHTLSTFWRCSIWMFCHCIKCSIHPAVIISRWGLQEWFWHYWPTHFLKETPPIHHMSSMEHASFNPAHTTPHSSATITHSSSPWTPTRPVHHCLSFTSDSSVDDQDQDSTLVYSDEDEDLPTVPLDDEHWTAEVVPERTFCIHDNGLPNTICQHPCPYGNNDTASYMDSLALSDISDYEDYMMTTSDDEDLLGMEEVPYWPLNSGLLEHLLNILILILISCA